MKFDANSHPNFFRQNAVAKAGERIVINAVKTELPACNKWGQPCILHDVSEIKMFQDKDIDIVIDSKSRPLQLHYDVRTTYEIKTDLRLNETNNLFIETETKRDNGYSTNGWLYKSQADYLLYYSPQRNEYYYMNLSVLREYVKNNKIRYVESYNSEEQAYNCGYLLNLNLARKIPNIEFYTLNTYEVFPFEELLNR
mgnify:FL=1